VILHDSASLHVSSDRRPGSLNQTQMRLCLVK